MILLGFTGFYLILLGFTGFYWVLLVNDGTRAVVVVVVVVVVAVVVVEWVDSGCGLMGLPGAGRF